MNKKDVKILGRVLEEIDFLEEVMQGFTFEMFGTNEEKKRVVIFTLINIAELVRILSEEFKTANKNIPFEKISKTRNISVHHYDMIDFETVWNTIKISIPDLKSKIEKLLEKPNLF